MLKKILIVIALFSIIFISGCMVEPSSSKYCSILGNCKVEESDSKVPDIVVVKDVKIIPAVDNTVRPNREVTIIVYLENRDEDREVDLEYVGISNPDIFECISCSQPGGKLGAGREKAFEFKLRSPDNSGTITFRSHLEFSVKYKYTSTRLATLTFIDKKTYIEYLVSGGKVDVSITNVASNGPVELYLDISKIKQPIIVGEEGIKSSKLSANQNSAFGTEIKLDSGCTQSFIVCYPDGTPVKGAQVYADHKTATTDERGHASISGLDYMTTYYATASLSPYQSSDLVSFTCNPSSSVILQLKPSPTPSQEPSQKPSQGSSPSQPTPSSQTPKEEEGQYFIYLELRNKGSGEIDEIAPGNLKITFEDMNLKAHSKEFKCEGNEAINIEPIVLRGKKILRYYFSFDPAVELNSNQITTVKKIQAEATYTYRLTKKIDILVSPKGEI